MEEQKISHYSSNQRILLVGEGDFSFSKCLATAFGSGANMVATSLDSKETLMVKYKTACANLLQLQELGCTILHEVNVHTMVCHCELLSDRFDRIIFNFPHAGFYKIREHDSFMIGQHQELLRGFFSSAREMLKANGEVHVTHKTVYPFNLWKIETLAREAGLSLVESAHFNPWLFVGYKNKRGDGNRSDDTFPASDSRTYKFSVD